MEKFKSLEEEKVTEKGHGRVETRIKFLYFSRCAAGKLATRIRALKKI